MVLWPVLVKGWLLHPDTFTVIHDDGNSLRQQHKQFVLPLHVGWSIKSCARRHKMAERS